jgi:hypothetical protein
VQMYPNKNGGLNFGPGLALIQLWTTGSWAFERNEDLVCEMRWNVKAGLHYQSFCDHSRNFA